MHSICGAILLATILAAPLIAHAQPTSTSSGQAYPSKPIRMLIPFPPGGSPDIVGRLIAAKLNERMGNQIVVDNRGGVGSAKRNAQVPDVPTIAQTLPGFESIQWWGLFVPAGTPAAIVERLTSEMKTALAQDDVKKRLTHEEADLDPIYTGEFARFIQTEITRWAGVAKKAGIKTD